ncbi:MAG: glycosyltransferase [Verrucomicrobia bacterium]|nr:glycosyltransferase [Verrucomicrobiota bacterium]
MDKKICLNMIVKDESAVIRRCLESVRPWIDYWVISDTGSTDETMQIVQECLKDVPGELHQRPWVDFATNRNEVLQFSKEKGDYVLFIDADETLQAAQDFKMPSLEKDYYSAVHRSGETDFLRVLLINNALNWKWFGAVHETPECPEAKTSERLSGIVNICEQDGNRSQDPEKFAKDIQILEAALEKDPTDTRNTFYLAQTYAIIADFPSALKMYEKRRTMGPPNQEVFWSIYQIGRIQEEMKEPAETFVKSYCDAHLARQSRAEPLFRLANHYLRVQNYYLAYLVAKEASLLHLTQDALYVERYIYEWGVLLQLAEAAMQIGRKAEALEACNKLKMVDSLPDEYRAKIEQVFPQ